MTEQQEQLLNEYLDGTLDEAGQAEAEALLATSAAARAFLATLQQMFSALDEMDDLPLPTDLSEQVVARLAAQPSLWERWLRWIIVTQLMIAGVVLMQLWPSIQDWFMLSRDAVTGFLRTFTWPALTIWQDVVAGATAVFDQLARSTPTIGLASGQWSLLIVLAFVAWLAGNRLLFSDK